MGRPSTIKPKPAGTSRRGFFRSGGGAAMALAAAPMAALAGDREDRDGRDAQLQFLHGVASGDPLADRVILWTRVTPSRPLPAGRSVAVRYVVYADASCRRAVLRGTVQTDAARDYTVKVDAAGLRPGTTYYYRFRAERARSPVGRTKTLPVGATPRLRMAVVSCSNHAYGYFNAYGRIAQRADLDLVVHLGDYIYEYGAGQYGSARTPEPPVEIVTLTDYRQRHAQYKADPDSQAMHRQHPLVAIWDDHETANNSWKGGAENHQPATEGGWDTRVKVALQAYYEWMPVRQPDPADPRRENRAFRFGNLVELLMLEERLGARSEQLPMPITLPNGQQAFVQSGPYLDPARQMLGAEQEAWLFGRLRQTPARWKLVGQGVMFAQLKAVGAPNAAGGGVFLNSDQWDGYAPARQRVYDALRGSSGQPGIDNVVVLTGDIHSSWAADITPDPNNPLPAAGGYDPATGEGSLAVEFVGTSVTSPGIDTDTTGAVANSLKPANPHFKYINLNRRGYMIVDVTRDRTVGEWWYVDTVASRSNIETFAAAFETRHGSNRLQPAVQTTPPANPPALADDGFARDDD
jgi:alkaline phosphatase D